MNQQMYGVLFQPSYIHSSSFPLANPLVKTLSSGDSMHQRHPGSTAPPTINSHGQGYVKDDKSLFLTS